MRPCAAKKKSRAIRGQSGNIFWFLFFKQGHATPPGNKKDIISSTLDVGNCRLALDGSRTHRTSVRFKSFVNSPRRVTKLPEKVEARYFRPITSTQPICSISCLS